MAAARVPEPFTATGDELSPWTAEAAPLTALLRDHAAAVGRTIRDLRSLRSDLRRLVDRADELDPAACDPQRVCHILDR